MTDLLYRWPSKAAFDRVVPKAKFYENGTVSAVVRQKFVVEVHRIKWAYKLAESTINIPGNTAVPEIQVFTIDAKGADVSEVVLGAIDKAVKTPIIYEIVEGEDRDGRVRMTAAHKQLGAGTPKLGTYFTTGWQSGCVERQALPTAITLSALYTALLSPLTPVVARPGEEVSEVAARLEKLRKLEREIAALQRKIRTEPQMNRKVELRRTLKRRQAELEQQR
jgi:hypothetical protein